MEAGPGHVIEVESLAEKATNPDTVQTYRHAENRSSSLRTNAPEVATHFTTTVNPASVGDGITASGSLSDISATLSSMGGGTILIVMGGLCILAAICFVGIPLALGGVPRTKTALFFAGGGILLIASGTVYDKYPLVFLLILVVPIVGLGIWLFNLWHSAKKDAALDTLTSAIETLPDAHKTAVKDTIAQVAKTKRIKSVADAVIDASKARQNL